MNEKSGDVRPSLMSKATGKDFMHDCTQGATLAIICEKLDNIENSISEVKENQKEYIITQNKMNERINIITNDLAKRPTSEEVRAAIKRVDAHDIFFAIIYTAVGAIIVVLVGLLSGFLYKLFGL